MKPYDPKYVVQRSVSSQSNMVTMIIKIAFFTGLMFLWRTFIHDSVRYEFLYVVVAHIIMGSGNEIEQKVALLLNLFRYILEGLDLLKRLWFGRVYIFLQIYVLTCADA